MLRRLFIKGGVKKMRVVVIAHKSEEQAREICADLPYAKLGMLRFDVYGTLPGLWPLTPASG